MAAIDYNSLRQTTLGSGLDEEAVTVNTRALIDKVLARYSGENTTLRELLQNAADANAKKVEIRFETSPPATKSLSVDTFETKPVGLNDELKRLSRAKCYRMLVKNDGVAFREEDWLRLKRIAEGNPDETKIGAFGVGFYSVFSECEEPFVSSGSQAMAFYWKGNQLFTRRAKLPRHDEFTTFLLEYRTPAEVPPLATLAQFLATSLTFVSLEKIDLYIDKYCITFITKKTSPSIPLSLPPGIDMSQRGKGAMVKIAGVLTENIQIDARVMAMVTFKEKIGVGAVVESVGGGLRGFWSRLSNNNTSSTSLVSTTPVPDAPGSNTASDLGDYTTSTIFLRVATAQLQTNVPANFAAELERATKKPPPRRTKLAMLTMSKDEVDASDTVSANADTYVFANILPTKVGKIFIGFPTHQTTAIRAHISAHSVIPTVERESIDFNARWVREWNAEMLRMAGILARITYWHEMDTLRRRLIGNSMKPLDKDAWLTIQPNATHAMQMFTFVESTPSPLVGQIVEEAFWQCSTSMELLSTKGVLPSEKVRILPADAQDLGGFLSNMAFLPALVMEGSPGFVKSLRTYNLITDITMTDVRRELEDRALTGKQMVVFLKWLSRKALNKEITKDLLTLLLSIAVATSSNGEDDNQADGAVPLSLQSIAYFVSASKLPPEMPVPPDCAPFSLTKTLKREELEALGWSDLSIPQWMRYITLPSTLKNIDVSHNLTLSPQFAGQVFAVLSKQWETISIPGRESIISLLRPLACVPTTKGMRVPRESYFHTVKLFKDLPLISPMAGVKDKFLVSLGVRKTLELALVLERLSAKDSQTETWSHIDLIKYFTSVKEDIPREDIERLRQTPFCKSEGDNKTMHKISGLYVPKEDLQELGCPILQWPGGVGGWRDGQTPEERFLILLGLQKYPNILTIVGMMTKSNTSASTREKALQYFITNHRINSYGANTLANSTAAFLPIRSDGKDLKYSTPSMCYVNPEAELLGFSVLRGDLKPHALKFGVSDDPPMDVCITRLIVKPPSDFARAQALFRYFASRMTEITSKTQITRLAEADIIPITKDGRTRLINPTSCFVGGENSEYREMFDFVNFGIDANAFLQKAGCKNEPTLSEIAYMLTRDAERLLHTVTATKYRQILRKIGEGFADLKKDKTLLRLMKRSNILYATIDKSKPKKGGGFDDDYDDDDGLKEFQLASAENVVIVDDYILFNIFKGDVLACPQEEELESLYSSLGAHGLSKRVQSEWTLGRPLNHPERLRKTRELVLERCRIFFHNNNSTVKHDAKWLDEHLQVRMVETIKLRRTLKPQNKSHLEDSTACIIDDALKENSLLHVTAKFLTFDVANQMTKLILQRPKPHSALLLESLMNSDLLVLRSRGYNVDRILKKKEHEAKLAEEQRNRMMLAQQKARDEAEKATNRKQDEPPSDAPPRYSDEVGNQSGQRMPGSFVNSPERVPLSNDEPGVIRREPRSKGFLHSLSKGLGLKNHGTGNDPNDSHPLAPGPNFGPFGPHGGMMPGATTGSPDDGKATSPEALTSNLKNAISSSRSWKSAGVFNQPRTQQVKEQNTYCDGAAGKDLVYNTTTTNNIKVYITRSTPDQDNFKQRHDRALRDFAGILKTISQVFDLPLATLHIYHEISSTIAFNSSGSLFCNLNYFLQLHENQVVAGNTSDALVYWFVVLCHELAHNIVQDHSAAHSYYSESFVQQYLTKLAEQLVQPRNAGQHELLAF